VDGTESKQITIMDIETLIAEGKWTEFLNALPLDKPKGYLFPSSKAMDSCKSVAYRMNVTDAERSFKVSMDYRSRIMTITASLKA